MAIERARLLELIRKNSLLFLDLASNINSSLDAKQILHNLTVDMKELKYDVWSHRSWF